VAWRAKGPDRSAAGTIRAALSEILSTSDLPTQDTASPAIRLRPAARLLRDWEEKA
jgi:hypothetical protein